jgi:ATP-binding cassette subfamily B protein
MLIIVRYLKKSWKSLILVLVLLIFKVIADLTLPFYTANIVNVGIQQGGIDSTIPSVISEQLMDEISRSLDDSATTVLREAYRYNKQAYRFPAFILEQPSSELEILLLQPLAQFSLGELAASTAPESILRQAALARIRADYELLGVDLNTQQMHYIATTGLYMIGISTLSVIASILVAFFASRTAANLGKQLRSDVFRKVVSFGQKEMDTFSTASLVTRSTNDIQQIQQSFVMILRVVIFAPLMALGGLFRVLSTNSSMSWTIGLAILAISTVVITMFSLVMPRFKQLQILLDEVNRVVRETLTGIPVIRAFTTQAHEQKRFAVANENLTKTTLFVNRSMSAMMPLMMLIMNLTTILIVWRGGLHIQSGTMQVGDMMAFIQYAMLIIMSFLMITMLTIMLPRAAVSASRIREILDTPVSIEEPDYSTGMNKPIGGHISFRNVGFTFPGASTKALSDISFEASPGTTTAIIGSTGSGKSTLLNLIPRFHEATSGSVEIDGVDIRTISLQDLRQCIGYVPQQGRLFSGSITSNIAFGNESLTEEEIVHAAKIAQAHEFITEKPDQYNAVISQGGQNVSGGQRQRLSIARAIASRPQILLFDDSFSALDYRTELSLRNELHTQLEHTTILIVAQRISSILHADSILVLDEGRLVGTGTHKELMKQCTVYRQIAQSQLSTEEIEQYE